MYYAELNVPKNHVYLFKPQPPAVRKFPSPTPPEKWYTVRNPERSP